MHRPRRGRARWCSLPAYFHPIHAVACKSFSFSLDGREYLVRVAVVCPRGCATQLVLKVGLEWRELGAIEERRAGVEQAGRDRHLEGHRDVLERGLVPRDLVRSCVDPLDKYATKGRTEGDGVSLGVKWGCGGR